MVIKPPPKLKSKATKKALARLNEAEITRHAVSIMALLVNERCLSVSEARSVLTKTLSLLREE
jgi:hypothetical protein